MSQSDSKPDDERLRDRIEALESTVESQQETMRKLMPSRRSVLQGAGGVGLGALGMSLFGSSASAQSAAGQVGTEENPVDVVLASLNMQGPLDMSGNDIENAGAVQAGRAVIGVDPADGGQGIQDAINGLPADGGTVSLRAGIYEVNEPIRVETDEITISGVGIGTHLKNVSDDPNLGLHEGIITGDADDCILKNLRLDGSAEPGDGSDDRSSGIYLRDGTEGWTI